MTARIATRIAAPKLNPQAAFADYCCELLLSIGPVRKRAMFGGFGIYAEDVMVALIAFERLFLKADATSMPEYVAAGCQPFLYDGKGKTVTMSYYEPPVDAMESQLQMRPWAKRAMESALRAANAKVKPKGKAQVTTSPNSCAKPKTKAKAKSKTKSSK
jgi:DNA transformation protein and related proteins